MRRPNLASAKSSLTLHSTALRGWWNGSLWNRLTVLSVVLYGVAFSILTTLRLYSLSSFGWDLGLYNQAMYTTVRGGQFFGISGIPGEPTQSLLGGHFSPILILLLLPYAVFPSPVTLVVIQSWAVAAGAIPTYLLGKAKLKVDRTAFLFALVFLLSPATQGVSWFDFHPEAFLLPALGAAILFLETRRWKAFILVTILALSTIELSAFLVASIAVAGILSEWYRIRTSEGAADLPKVRALAGSLVLSIAWFVVAGFVSGALNPAAEPLGGVSSEWSVLGATGMGSIPIQIVLHPDLAAAALAYDGAAKVWYLLVLFLPVEFLTVRSPRAMFSCLPWLTLALFSNFPSYYRVGNQYPAYILPFIFYGAIRGMAEPWPAPALVSRAVRRLRRALELQEGGRGTARVMLVATLVLLLVASPLGPWGLGSDDTGRFPALTSHDLAVLSLVEMVPADASVVTQNNLYPLLSGRVSARLIPVNRQFLPGTSFNGTMDAWASSTDYILLDPETGFVEAALLFYWPSIVANYSVVGAADGAILLERGQHALSQFTPLNRDINSEDVVPVDASLVHDPTSSTGVALLHSNVSTSHFWYGPFLVLTPGTYTVTYRLKADRMPIGTALDLPVLLHPVQINGTVLAGPQGVQEVSFSLNQLASQIYVAARSVAPSAFSAFNLYIPISMTFNVTTLGIFEFPGHNASGSLQLWLDSIDVVQETATWAGGVPVEWSTG